MDLEVQELIKRKRILYISILKFKKEARKMLELGNYARTSILLKVIKGKLYELKKIERILEMKKKSRYSRDEQIIMNVLSEIGYEYLARDDDGELNCFFEKPTKNKGHWSEINSSTPLTRFSWLFKWVGYNEPQKIKYKEID